MMIHELDTVVLQEDVTEKGLVAGDLGVVVLTHGSGDGYEVEFLTLKGEAVAVISLTSHQIRPIARWEIAHAREVLAH